MALQPTAGFMASVTCGLTAEDRDQLRNPTFLSSMGLPFTPWVCASGCVIECRICNRKVVIIIIIISNLYSAYYKKNIGLNLSRGYFAPRFNQPFIPPGLVHEY